MRHVDCFVSDCVLREHILDVLESNLGVVLRKIQGRVRANPSQPLSEHDRGHLYRHYKSWQPGPGVFVTNQGKT